MFRLFESDAAPPVEGVVFVSRFTGSGIPAPLPKMNYWSVPWVIGILATLLFWMIIAIGWTGRIATQAHDFMLGTQPEYTADLASAAFAVCAPTCRHRRPARHRHRALGTRMHRSRRTGQR